MKKPHQVAADGVSNNSVIDPNLQETAPKNNTGDDLARRDARAMVKLLNTLKSGLEPYEVVYDSLKNLHGKAFEKYFRELLTGRNRDGYVIE